LPGWKEAGERVKSAGDKIAGAPDYSLKLAAGMAAIAGNLESVFRVLA
jgi:hypothetical protein